MCVRAYVSRRAIRLHNPKDWQKDPAASLNFPERAGEDLHSPCSEALRVPAAAHYNADVVNQTGVVTPVGGGGRSSSTGGEASTPGKAKITPFHAKLMGASHHPIPSRSFYPGALTLRAQGSDFEGSVHFHAACSMSSLLGAVKNEAGSAVSKLLDLKGPADVAPENEQAGDDKAAVRPAVSLVSTQGGKEPSPNL